MDPSCTHELRRVPSTPAGHAHSEEVHQQLTHWGLLGADTLDGPSKSRHSKQYLTQAPLCSPRRHQPGIALYTPKRWTLLEPTLLLHGPRHTHIHRTGAGAKTLPCKDDNACNMTSQN